MPQRANPIDLNSKGVKMKSGKKSKRCQKKIITKEHRAIRKVRLELGLTLKDAGDKLGLSSKGIGAIENGRVILDKNRIMEIVSSYGLDYQNFLDIRDEVETNKQSKYERRRSSKKIITKECLVLKSMRRVKNLSQVKASALCGYPRSAIGKIEHGRIELSEMKIRHIVEAYGYRYPDFVDNLSKEELRDTIVDSCIKRIEQLDDIKLAIVRNLLDSL